MQVCTIIPKSLFLELETSNFGFVDLPTSSVSPESPEPSESLELSESPEPGESPEPSKKS